MCSRQTRNWLISRSPARQLENQGAIDLPLATTRDVSRLDREFVRLPRSTGITPTRNSGLFQFNTDNQTVIETLG